MSTVHTAGTVLTSLGARTVVVALTADTGPQQVPARAAGILSAHGLTPVGVAPYFTARSWRSRDLVGRWHRLTAGGRVQSLDLDGMRRQAENAASAQWLLWRYVVADTRPAKPFWVFLDRHAEDRCRYPLARAQTDYTTQPRVLAMAAFNALPGAPYRLPTSALEAFQTGAAAYATLAWLTAVPGDALVTAGGAWLTSPTGRLTDQVTYLHAANWQFNHLHPHDYLVAVQTA